MNEIKTEALNPLGAEPAEIVNKKWSKMNRRIKTAAVKKDSAKKFATRIRHKVSVTSVFEFEGCRS